MKAWWLRTAMTLKRKPDDTRPFFVRLFASIRPIIKFNKRGVTFVGVKGGANF